MKKKWLIITFTLLLFVWVVPGFNPGLRGYNPVRYFVGEYILRGPYKIYTAEIVTHAGSPGDSIELYTNYIVDKECLGLPFSTQTKKVDKDSKRLLYHDYCFGLKFTD